MADSPPLHQELGLGIVPWAPLGQGLLTGKYNSISVEEASDSLKSLPEDRAESAEKIKVDTRRAKVALTEWNAKNRAVALEVQAISQETGHSCAQVALNWCLQKPGVTSPIFGARKMEHFMDVVGALDFRLSAAHMQRLDKLSEVDVGFPQRWGGGHFFTDGGCKIVSEW
mmetsp:Transcript_20125/g.56599  ORF Transcript_20125/g.56599 Transcript_20125/m.56599 type:complete len:170 (-) Transcript_20125:457-966(-)